MAAQVDPRLPLKDKKLFSNESQSKGKLRNSEAEASKNTGNPFEWLTNENIGRRTGKDILGSKVIRKDKYGFENFDDYWSESEADSILNDTSHVSNRSRGTKEERSCKEKVTSKIQLQTRKNTVNPFEWMKNENLGRRTGKDILGSKVIRKDEYGFENFDDYWSESDADSILTDASHISKGSQRKSCQEEGTSEHEMEMKADSSIVLRQDKEQADALVKTSIDEVETGKMLTDDSQMSQDNENSSQDSQCNSVTSSQESVIANTVKKRPSLKLSMIQEGDTKESQLIMELRTADKTMSTSHLKDSVSQTYQPLIEASKTIPLDYSTDSATGVMTLPNNNLHHKETSSTQEASRKAHKLNKETLNSPNDSLQPSVSVVAQNSNEGELTMKCDVVEDKTVHIVEVVSKPRSPKSSCRKYSVSKTNIRVNMTESISTASGSMTLNVRKEQGTEPQNPQNITLRRSRTRSKCCNSAAAWNESADKSNSGDGNSFLVTKTCSKQLGEQKKETVRTEVNKLSEIVSASVPDSSEDRCSSQVDRKEGVDEGPSSSQPIDVGGNTTGSITRIENPSSLNSSVSFNRTRKRLSFNALEEQKNLAAISMKSGPSRRVSDGQKHSAEEKFQLSIYTRKSIPSMYENIPEESDTSETFLTLAAMSQKSQRIQTTPSVTLEDEFDIVDDGFVFRLSSDDEGKSKGRNGGKNLPNKGNKSKLNRSAKTKELEHDVNGTISKATSTDDPKNVDKATHTKTATSKRKGKVKYATSSKASNVETETLSKEIAHECSQQVEVNQVLNSVNDNDASVRPRKKKRRQSKSKGMSVEEEEVAEVAGTVFDGAYKNKSTSSVKKSKCKRGRHMKNNALNSGNSLVDNISSISEKLKTNAEENVLHLSKQGTLSPTGTEFQNDNQSTMRKRKVDSTMEKMDNISLDIKQKALEVRSSPIKKLITYKMAPLDDIGTKKAEKLIIEHATRKGRKKELVSKIKREKRMRKTKQKQPKSTKNSSVKRVKPMESKATVVLNAVDSACHMVGDPVQGSVSSTRLSVSSHTFNTPVTSNTGASLNDFLHSEVFKSGVSFRYRKSEVMHLSQDHDSEKPQEIESTHVEGLTPCIIKDNAHRKSKGRRVTINEIVQKLSSQKSAAKLETETAFQDMTQDDSMSVIMPKTPIHIFETTTSKTLEPLGSQLESKIIYPEPAPEGLRRSKRIRLKPLEWYKNERVILEITETDCKIIGVQPSKEAEILKMEDEKRRRRRLKMLLKKREKAATRQRSSTGANLSVHTELPHNLQMSSSNDIPVLQADTQQEQDLECLAPQNMYEFVGPNGDPATKEDPFVLAIMLNQPFFNMGTLVLQPLAEKTEQLVTAYAVCFTIRRGKICVKIHRTSTVMETGDKFFIPIGNVYSLKNLRSDSATLDFVVFKDNDVASTSVFTGTGTQDD